MSAEFPTDPVQLTQKLVQIPSDKVSGEVALAKYITAYVGETAPNFRATLIPTADPNRPSLIVANHELPDFVAIAHYDTVLPWTVGSEQNQGQFDPHGGTISEGKVYGRGAADAKHTVANLLTIAASVNTLPRAAFVFPSDEEGKFLGSEALVPHFADLMAKNPDYRPAFVLSTNGNTGEVSYGCRGLFELNVEVAGRTAHSAIRKPGRPTPINAFDIGISAYQDLKAILADLEPNHLGKTTVNAAGGEYGLKQENGGLVTSYNSVPDLYRAAFEFRTNGGIFFPGKLINAANTLEYLSNMIANKDASADITIRQERAAWLANRSDAAWLEQIIKEVRRINEVPEWVYGEHGYDEIAMFMEAFNRGSERLVPAAIYGVVDGLLFHAVDENAPVEDIRTMQEILVRTITSPELRRQSFSTPS